MKKNHLYLQKFYKNLKSEDKKEIASFMSKEIGVYSSRTSDNAFDL